jgi:threonine dehydrogenase-like Zn-dependent dehydrogenase
VLRRPPRPGAPCLVIGAGTIGLASIAALTELAPESRITVLARHAHQAAAAKALGAHDVITSGESGDDVSTLAEASGGRVTGAGRAALVWGGFPYVVEAVGAVSSMNLALKVAGQEGTLLLLGAIANATVDLGPLWFKNVDVVGSFGYAMHDLAGERLHTFDLALRVLARGAFPSDVLVTHTFALHDVHEALRVANARGQGSLKVQLVP